MEFPESSATVTVSLLDTEFDLQGMPAAAFTQPDMPGRKMMDSPVAFSFLITRNDSSIPSKFQHMLFDLGARKDFDNSPPAILRSLKSIGAKVVSSKSCFDILKSKNFDPADINGIIWSHAHMDHTGNPAEFPTSTSLIVGPGFKKDLMPGWPTNPNSALDEKAWEGREVIEIDFEDAEKGLMLGQYKAFDFYGDGSFYLFHSPGHTAGHICALARTSSQPSEFILLGGDIAHHGSEFRPTKYIPLPKVIVPNPLVAPFTKTSLICPGSIFEAIHPKKSSTEPFLEVRGPAHEDQGLAGESVKKLLEFDAQDNVFVIIAHDSSLVDIVDHFPKTLNDWKKKSWKTEGFWRFLRDFDTGNPNYKL